MRFLYDLQRHTCQNTFSDATIELTSPNKVTKDILHVLIKVKIQIYNKQKLFGAPKKIFAIYQFQPPSEKKFDSIFMISGLYGPKKHMFLKNFKICPQPAVILCTKIPKMRSK